MAQIKSQRLYVIIAAVIFLLFFLLAIGAIKPISSWLQRIGNPVLVRFYSVGSMITSKFEEQTSRVDYISENKRLQDEIAVLLKENVELKMVEEENNVLREQLGFLKKNPYKYVTANVVAKGEGLDFPGQSETIDIDKGTRDGVYPGMPVITGQGVIIGKVSEAKENLSKIYLTNSKKCQLAATILNQSKTSGIAEGDLGLTINMNFIPQNVELNEGDIAITSGLEKSIPRGLIIGRIGIINRDANELWQNAVIEPILDYDNLLIVSVLIQ